MGKFPDHLTPGQDKSFTSLGPFLIGWSYVEGTLEMAIAKSLRLSPINGSLVLSQLAFSQKLNLLKSLVNRSAAPNQLVINALNMLSNITERNDIAHGIIERFDGDSLVLLRRRNNGRFKSEEKTFNFNKIKELSGKLAAIRLILIGEYNIGVKFQETYFRQAHLAAQRPSRPKRPRKRGGAGPVPTEPEGDEPRAMPSST
jgi:hypothetical protein